MKKPQEAEPMMTSPISPEVALALGELTAHWNLLEAQLPTILMRLLRIDQFRAQIILATFQSNRPKLTLLEGLGNSYLKDDRAARLRSLLRRTRKFASVRNALIHGVYGAGKPASTNTLFSISITEKGAGLTFESADIGAKYIRTHTKYIGILAGALLMFGLQIHEPGAVETLPKIHREPQKPRHNGRAAHPQGEAKTSET